MSVLPANKLLKIFKGTTFDYPFQYMVGTITAGAPVNLTGYTASWHIVPTIGSAVTYTASVSSGQSGVFFGGDDNDPTNGIIDLVLIASATTAITWQIATYTLILTTPGAIVVPLLTGGIGIAGTV